MLNVAKIKIEHLPSLACSPVANEVLGSPWELLHASSGEPRNFVSGFCLRILVSLRVLRTEYQCVYTANNAVILCW